jgi:hypothetical protein
MTVEAFWLERQGLRAAFSPVWDPMLVAARDLMKKM